MITFIWQNSPLPNCIPSPTPPSVILATVILFSFQWGKGLPLVCVEDKPLGNGAANQSSFETWRPGRICKRGLRKTGNKKWPHERTKSQGGRSVGRVRQCVAKVQQAIGGQGSERKPGTKTLAGPNGCPAGCFDQAGQSYRGGPLPCHPSILPPPTK